MPRSKPRAEIADLALLSDCQSAALVDGQGSISWLCLPRFDSPAVFASLLDPRGGQWSLRPEGLSESTRRYLPESLVLETTFVTPAGRAVLTDALVLGEGERGHDIGRRSPHVLVRTVEVTAGRVTVEGAFAPRGQYGLVAPRWIRHGSALVADLGDIELTLCGPAADELSTDDARWTRELSAGHSLTFGLLSRTGESTPTRPWPEAEILNRLADTGRAWRSWSALHHSYDGSWREQVRLSGRILQGLTYAPTGAVIAAPTTSLPAQLHRVPSWDHRYSCLHDAVCVATAQRFAACPVEATRHVSWLVDTVSGGSTTEGLQTVFGVGGELDLGEELLVAAHGWHQPAAMGSGRWRRRDSEGAGELLAAVYLLRDHLTPPVGDRRAVLVRAVETIRSRPSPGGARTAVMDWLALNRAAALPDWFDASAAGPTPRLIEAATHMRAAVLRGGWDASTGGYSGFNGRSLVEAASLLLCLSGLLAARDPVMGRTVELVAERLSAPCGLIYRDEDAPEREGPSVVCTFWLVECLAAAGQLDRATAIFDQASAYANDVGLLSEDADPRTGQLLGHFPRASSHAGLIDAVAALERGRVTPS
jgi:GH15 family glucan-1,4-alpha-glucosidase